MAYFWATYTCPTSTGNFTMSSLPFTPVRAKFTTGPKSGAVNSESRHAVGWTDGTNAYSQCMVNNSNGHYSKAYTDRCLTVLSTPGGTPALEVYAYLVSFGTNQCTLNFPSTSNTYTFVAEFWDS